MLNVLQPRGNFKYHQRGFSKTNREAIGDANRKIDPTTFRRKVFQAGKSLTETIIAAAKEKLPEAIREFNIGGVVREKINHYPVEKLESLVLSVAKEHLRTIELFGALFGLIIGIVQVVVSYFFFVFYF